jgi:hypothetical protein
MSQYDYRRCFGRFCAIWMVLILAILLISCTRQPEQSAKSKKTERAYSEHYPYGGYSKIKKNE